MNISAYEFLSILQAKEAGQVEEKKPEAAGSEYLAVAVEYCVVGIDVPLDISCHLIAVFRNKSGIIKNLDVIRTCERNSEATVGINATEAVAFS